VQWSNGFTMFREVGIEIRSAGEGPIWEEFGYAVALGRKFHSIWREKRKERVRHTAFCANAARRKKAFVTVTALNSLFATASARPSTVLSVILISSAVSTCFAIGRVFNGILAIFGIVGSIRAIVASRWACRSAATSCHVAPEAIVTVGDIGSRLWGEWIILEYRTRGEG
jgi:hypothetical protein